MREKLGIAIAATVLAVAAAAVLAGCGGDGDSDAVASLTGTTSASDGDGGSAESEKNDQKEAALDYAQCMRDHGVDMPDPGSGGELRLEVTPQTEDKFEEAQKACEHILADARPRLTEEQQGVMKEALLAFARCMREHGIDMPDPEFGKGGLVTQKGKAGSRLNPDDPKFQEARKACEPIMKEAQRNAGLPQGSPRFGRSSDR